MKLMFDNETLHFYRENFIALNITRQFPLVLLINVSWW